jgi:putative transposon-encoded protein
MDDLEITTKGYAVVDRKAGKSGNSARVHVPIAWAGLKVRAILLEPIPEKKEGE